MSPVVTVEEEDGKGGVRQEERGKTTASEGTNKNKLQHNQKKYKEESKNEKILKIREHH